MDDAWVLGALAGKGGHVPTLEPHILILPPLMREVVDEGVCAGWIVGVGPAIEQGVTPQSQGRVTCCGRGRAGTQGGLDLSLGCAAVSVCDLGVTLLPPDWISVSLMKLGTRGQLESRSDLASWMGGGCKETKELFAKGGPWLMQVKRWSHTAAWAQGYSGAAFPGAWAGRHKGCASGTRQGLV